MHAGPAGSMAEFFFWLFLVTGLAIAAVILVRWLAKRRQQAWYAMVEHVNAEEAEARRAEEERNRRHASVSEAIAALSGTDEAFSWVVFEDFLYALFTEIHTLRGRRKLDWARPYLTEAARVALSERGVDGVSGIIVGSMRVETVRGNVETRRIEVVCLFVANFTEKFGPREQSFYVEERWRLTRSADVKSRPPKQASVIGCPGCGVTLEKQIGLACEHCGTPASSDDHDWRVEHIAEIEREKRGPLLTGTTQETGTQSPTVVAADAKARLAELTANDPTFTWAGFVRRVDEIFHAFHVAWSSQELAGTRPYLSDALFETQRYWIAAYKAQGLRNVTESPTIVTVHCARVTRDAHFEAMTVRVFATCLDYTLDAKGDIVGGHMKEAREYSEYWTLVRARGTATKAARPDPGCPNCGAPVAHINMAGTCEKCDAKVTLGAFDWVLSRIEQDEVYEG